MKNERGLTLVELLGVLAIMGVVSALIISVLIDGMNASKRSTTKQRLQQEANYITEVVRKVYLEPYVNGMSPIEFKVEGVDENQVLTMNNDIIISEGYKYEFINEADPTMYTMGREGAQSFSLNLTKDGLTYPIEMTFSKLE